MPITKMFGNQTLSGPQVAASVDSGISGATFGSMFSAIPSATPSLAPAASARQIAAYAPSFDAGAAVTPAVTASQPRPTLVKTFTEELSESIRLEVEPSLRTKVIAGAAALSPPLAPTLAPLVAASYAGDKNDAALKTAAASYLDSQYGRVDTSHVTPALTELGRGNVTTPLADGLIAGVQVPRTGVSEWTPEQRTKLQSGLTELEQRGAEISSLREQLLQTARADGPTKIAFNQEMLTKYATAVRAANETASGLRAFFTPQTGATASFGELAQRRLATMSAADPNKIGGESVSMIAAAEADLRTRLAGDPASTVSPAAVSGLVWRDASGKIRTGSAETPPEMVDARWDGRTPFTSVAAVDKAISEASTDEMNARLEANGLNPEKVWENLRSALLGKMAPVAAAFDKLSVAQTGLLRTKALRDEQLKAVESTAGAVSSVTSANASEDTSKWVPEARSEEEARRSSADLEIRQWKNRADGLRAEVERGAYDDAPDRLQSRVDTLDAELKDINMRVQSGKNAVKFSGNGKRDYGDGFLSGTDFEGGSFRSSEHWGRTLMALGSIAAPATPLLTTFWLNPRQEDKRWKREKESLELQFEYWTKQFQMQQQGELDQIAAQYAGAAGLKATEEGGSGGGDPVGNPSIQLASAK